MQLRSSGLILTFGRSSFDKGLSGVFRLQKNAKPILEGTLQFPSERAVGQSFKLKTKEGVVCIEKYYSRFYSRLEFVEGEWRRVDE